MTDWVRLVKALELADVRCLSFREMLDRVSMIWCDSQRSTIVFRILELSLSEEDAHALSQAVMHVLTDSRPRLAYRERDRVERCLARLLRRCPPGDVAAIVPALLDAKSKRRRRLAYSILTKVGVGGLESRLIALHKQVGDDESLQLLARFPHGLPRGSEMYVLDGLDDSYWRARLAAFLIEERGEYARTLARHYPMELLWAVGRTGNPAHLHLVRSLTSRRWRDIEVMTWAVWALGRLGARDELQSLKNRLGKNGMLAMPSGQ